MTHKNYLTLTLCSLALALLSGCSTPGLGGSDYTTTEVRGEQSVRLGTVESLRKVRIQSNEPGILGALGGGVAGAALGSTIGGGNGNAAATVLGALAAGAAGDAAQNALSTQNGVEITIRLDSGYVIAVTQGADEVFHVGDRVQVLGGGGATRVTKLDPNSSLGPTGRSSSTPSGMAPGNGQQIHYYCPDSNAYYPAVPNCKSPWMKVVR
ncbi:hypothetical protein [Ferrovum sp.]|uniref:outer membrane lipoprotein n=1 Tax=Ferrovum sp. TaxID=2609467 RepID=UPI00260DB927|nr:hypothetical protein [Ferrovum sp.]